MTGEQILSFQKNLRETTVLPGSIIFNKGLPLSSGRVIDLIENKAGKPFIQPYNPLGIIPLFLNDSNSSNKGFR